MVGFNGLYAPSVQREGRGLCAGLSVRRDAASLGRPQHPLPCCAVTGDWRQKVKPLTPRGFRTSSGQFSSDMGAVMDFIFLYFLDKALLMAVIPL